MNTALTVVIGMSVMYIFSLAGLLLAWTHFNKHKKEQATK